MQYGSVVQNFMHIVVPVRITVERFIVRQHTRKFLQTLMNIQITNRNIQIIEEKEQEKKTTQTTTKHVPPVKRRG
jgi:hypothetical protein